MEQYLIQKAQQVMEALSTERSLEERLQEARMHVSAIDRELYIKSAPATVRDSIEEVLRPTSNYSNFAQSKALGSFVQHVFEEAGRDGTSS